MKFKYPKRFVIGVTGGIATGKSSVLKELARRGFAVLSSDHLAHQCLMPRHPCYRSVVLHFGFKILNSKRQIDRNVLGGIVFSNPKERKWLERCIHPYVIQGLTSFIHQHQGKIALDIPLLYEARLSRLVDCVLVVWSTQKDQLDRLRLRNHLNGRDAKRRIQAQWPLSYKKKHAGFVLANTGAKTTLGRKVSEFLGKLNKDSVLEKA